MLSQPMRIVRATLALAGPAQFRQHLVAVRAPPTATFLQAAVL